MKKGFLRAHGKGGLELVEEAVVLLRSCPADILALYFLGSVPFVAGFLIFCADLSRHPDASDHLGSATLGITALFLWMKFFHARFGRALLSRLRGEPSPGWTPGEIFRSLTAQAIIQSTALLVLPFALLAVLPFSWAYAFYQNVSALDDANTTPGALIRSAAQQSALWVGQNHVLLSVVSGFGLFVFLNWITLGFTLPQLLNMFFGIESFITQSPLGLLNTTFFAAVIALTYLCVDPLLKTCYVLRCFYGKSLQSGDDLKSDIRRLSGRASTLVACLLFCLVSPTLPAAEAGPAPTPAVVSGELDRSITTVIQQGKYTWRSPREKVVEKKEGVLSGFFKNLVDMLKKPFDTIKDLLEKISDWLSRRDRSSATAENNPGWTTPQIGLLFAILAVFACVLAIVAMRIVRSRRRSTEVHSTAVATVPDLENENTAADELPEDDWTKLGRRCLDQGELRLALRAFYLASLAHLASRSLITIARSKSNRDYERELRRRGHALPELPTLFSENVSIFDRTWYGLHEVNLDLVETFIGNLEKIKRAA